MTKKEERLYNAWMNEPGTGSNSPLYRAWAAAFKRNVLQRARRASPEAKAKEALASRRSYAKKRGRAMPTCGCEICLAYDKKHKLEMFA